MVATMSGLSDAVDAMTKRRRCEGEHRIVERIYDPKPGTDRLLDALRFLYEDSLAHEAAERLRVKTGRSTVPDDRDQSRVRDRSEGD